MANEFKHKTVGVELTQTEFEAGDGHVFDSQAIGDIPYAISSTQISRLGIGSTGAVLTVISGIPAWDTTWTPTGHLIPATDDSYDLGSASAAWQDLFLEGDITLTDAGTLATSAGGLTITSAAAATWSTSVGALTVTSAGALNLNAAGVLTLDSGAAINIEPASGSAILLDGTISIDAGVVTGATSITSTAFVGALTGNVTGNASGTAATVTGGTQASITTVANVVEVGALDAGSITSGFTSIDVGSGAITTTGLVSAGSLTVTGTTTLNGNLILGDAAADTLTISATIQGATPLVFEGASAGEYETSFAITNPSADRTVTFADLTGTVALTGVAQAWSTTGTVATGALTVTGDEIIGNGYGLVVGHTAKVTVNTTVPEFQVLGTSSGADAGMVVGAWNATDPRFHFVSSAHATIGSFSALQNNYSVGQILWMVDDGVDYISQGASINVLMTSNAASNNTPTKMVFSTNGGSASTTVALTIDENQDTNIPLGSKFAFDTGAGDTYIYQESADDLHITVGGVAMIQIDQNLNAGAGAIGYGSGAPNAGFFHRFGSTFTGAGVGDSHGVVFDGTMTGGSGDTGRLSMVEVQGTITTQSATENIGHVSTLAVRPVTLNDNLGGSGVVTVAATIHVSGAPSVGTTKAAIYVASGVIHQADTTDSVSKTTGAIINAGGMGINQSLFVGGRTALLDRVGIGAGNDSTANLLVTGDFAAGTTQVGVKITPTLDGTTWARGISLGVINDTIITVVELANIYIANATNNGTITTQYGIYFENLTAGGTDWAIYNSGGAGNNFGSGISFIGDTENCNMTVGLTINQGANDDQILAFKSSDVNTGLTTVTSPDVELHDYATFSKSSSAGGGLKIQALNMNDSNSQVLSINAWGGTAQTTKTTSAESLIQFDVNETDGSNGRSDITSNGNIFGISCRVGGTTVTRMLVDEDGDLYSVTSAQTFDDYDDIALIETYDAARSGSLKEQIKADFGRTMLMDEDTLIEAGVLGDTMANGGLTNQTQLLRVLTGGVRQLNTKHMSLVEEVTSLKTQLKALTEAK